MPEGSIAIVTDVSAKSKSDDTIANFELRHAFAQVYDGPSQILP
jgi:hypothetical protein